MSTSRASRSLASIVGGNVSAARKGAGLTQSQLAARLRVNGPMLVSCWERGVHRPKDENLVALAEVLGRDVSWFYVDHELEQAA